MISDHQKAGNMQILILAYVLLSFTMINCSRELPESKVPSLVQNAFRTRFIDAKDIDWEKNGRLYVVEFEMGASDEDHKVLFDTVGTVVMYKYEIASGRLPAPVIHTLHTKYQDYEIDEVENLQKDGINYYQVELEKRKKKQHLVFSDDGTMNNNINFWD
jgi:hypothetical protein